MNKHYLNRRTKIKFKIRKKIKGTPEKPRLVVFRSLKNIYAQLIDDVGGKTLVAASSLEKELSAKMKDVKGKTGQSKLLGKLIAERAKEAKIEKVVFDRNGYLYHGRVKAVADGARESGLIF